MSNLSEWVLQATPEELEAADWKCVEHALRKAQKQFEETGQGRQSWIDPYIQIAKSRSEDKKK